MGIGLFARIVLVFYKVSSRLLYSCRNGRAEPVPFPDIDSNCTDRVPDFRFSRLVGMFGTFSFGCHSFSVVSSRTDWAVFVMCQRCFFSSHRQRLIAKPMAQHPRFVSDYIRGVDDDNDGAVLLTTLTPLPTMYDHQQTIQYGHFPTIPIDEAWQSSQTQPKMESLGEATRPDRTLLFLFSLSLLPIFHPFLLSSPTSQPPVSLVDKLTARKSGTLAHSLTHSHAYVRSNDISGMMSFMGVWT